MRSAEEVAEKIGEIYEETFGGKQRGRFQISRSKFKKLAGRKRLTVALTNEVFDECWELGFIPIDMDEYIAFIEEDIVSNYRKVPKSVMEDFE